MVSYQSKFDQAFAAGTNGNPNFAAVFNASELRGQALFTSLGCAQCHTTGGQVSDTIHNIGLEVVTSDPGAGSGRFKAPSLRNVAARARFMHDARFGGNSNGTVRKLNLSAPDDNDLINFLNTLTDSVFLNDPKSADPF